MLGCNLSGDDISIPNSSDGEIENVPSMTTGDAVVALWSGNSFYEGVVGDISGDQYTIKWSDGSNPTEVYKSHIYKIPTEGTKHNISAGDIVLAKLRTDTLWDAAKVIKVNENSYEIKSIRDEKTDILTEDKIIKITSATAILLKSKSSTPAPPENYEPKVNDKVLALWSTNSWWSAKITDVKNGKITVAWDDDSPPKELDKENVYPLPNEEKISTDQFILAKPESGTKWVYAQVVSTDSDQLNIKETNGKSRTVKNENAVPLK